MVNSSLNNNVLTNPVVGSSIYHKQSTLPIKKKLALRDVQNENRSFVPTYPENNFLGRQVEDPIKVLGSKILSPEIPPSGAPCHQFPSISSASNPLMPGGAARKLDSELGKRKVQCLTEENTGCLNSKRPCSHKQPDLPKEGTKKEGGTSTVPASAPMLLASPVKYSPGQPASPVFLGKPTETSPAAHSSHLRFTPGYVSPYMVDSQRNHEEQRTERFLHLQNLLQHFDEPDHKDYIELLRSLHSSELSRHAVELEKRSMQLSVEEGHSTHKSNNKRDPEDEISKHIGEVFNDKQFSNSIPVCSVQKVKSSQHNSCALCIL